MYDKSVVFYKDTDDDQDPNDTSKRDKPMYLRDYHRENLLNGSAEAEGVASGKPRTYDEEQADLKASIVKEIHDAAGDSDQQDEDEASDTEFMKAKAWPARAAKSAPISLDVDTADRDPETFLSNFMSSRAWAAHEHSAPLPFESDDEDEEQKAEEFEEAYNFRFEDPAKANEKLMSHARDIASKYSARREEKNARKKHREAEREKKDALKQQLAEEKARLRKLRIEEMEEKLRRVKRAAGLSGKTLDEKDWKKFLDNDWDDTQWDEVMQKHFGAEYYAAEDDDSDRETAEPVGNKKKKVKKPQWDDDIDIKDLVPDFEDNDKASFSLSEPEDEAGIQSVSSKKSIKQLKQERSEKKKAARLDRQKIEQIVDEQLNLEAPFLSKTKPKQGAVVFRYRETSPVSYGLSARDILMAEDSQLNQFAGLKKLATFRDPEKKRKDQKHLGKKARLRQWRKDTFGNEEGPVDEDSTMGPDTSSAPADIDGNDGEGVDIREGGKKNRRRTKKKRTAQKV